MNNFYKANGNISKLIRNFNLNIENLFYLKIKVLVPNEDKSIFEKDLLMYETLKETLKDTLREIVFINEHFFFGMLTEYTTILFERLYHIIDMK